MQISNRGMASKLGRIGKSDKTDDAKATQESSSAKETPQSKPTASDKNMIKSALTSISNVFKKIAESLFSSGNKTAVTEKTEQPSISKQNTKIDKSESKKFECKNDSVDKKTNKEIIKAFSQSTTYNVTLSQSNEGGVVPEFSSKIVGKKTEGQDTVECGKGRVTAEPDVALHSGSTYGTATVSSMMTESAISDMLGNESFTSAINGEVSTALSVIKNLGLTQDVKEFLMNYAADPKNESNPKHISALMSDNPSSFSTVVDGMTPKQQAQLYNDVMTMSRGLSIVDTQKGEGNTTILREGLLNETKSKPDMDGNEVKMIANEKLFSTFMNAVGNDKMGVTYCYTTVNVQSKKSTPMNQDELSSLRTLSDNKLKDSPLEVKEKANSILEKLGENNPPETKLELKFQFDRIISKNSGDEKVAVNKHCKSGKDRTGALSQATSIRNQTLDALGEKAGGVTFYSLEDAKTHFDEVEGGSDTFKEMMGKMNEDLFKANEFNCKEHCARVMEEPAGEGSGRYGEMTSGVKQWAMGDDYKSKITVANGDTFTGLSSKTGGINLGIGKLAMTR